MLFSYTECHREDTEKRREILLQLCVPLCLLCATLCQFLKLSAKFELSSWDFFILLDRLYP